MPAFVRPCNGGCPDADQPTGKPPGARTGALRTAPIAKTRTGAGDGIRTHDPNHGKVVLYP